MAGARDSAETVIASAGDVYVATVGATAPTDADSPLASEWYKLGYTNEDGVTMAHAPEIEEFAVWQSRQPIRREAVDTTQTLAFAMAQWNSETVKFAFGGGNMVEESPGDWRYDFPSGEDALDERAIVVDFQDGDNFLGRIYFQRGSVTEAVESQFTRGALALLPVTFSVLAPTGGGSPGNMWATSAAFHS
jgi:hypothetical protein